MNWGHRHRVWRLLEVSFVPSNVTRGTKSLLLCQWGGLWPECALLRRFVLDLGSSNIEAMTSSPD
jgi:hypothetical protein